MMERSAKQRSIRRRWNHTTATGSSSNNRGVGTTDDEADPARRWRSSAEVADLSTDPGILGGRRTKTESRKNYRVRGSGRPRPINILLVCPVAELTGRARWSRVRSTVRDDAAAVSSVRSLELDQYPYWASVTS